ncbi:MAG: hypothetical protein ACE5Q6_20465 [Dehalococcoidia bacterium]
MDTGLGGLDIQQHLGSSERILSVFRPFYATSHRVLRLDPEDGPSRGYLLEIHYNQLTSVDLVRRSNHLLMAAGTIMVILGLLLTTVLFFSSIFAVLVGAGFLFVGFKGKPGYYQISARDLPRQAERYWQVEYNRSGSFIATIRSAIGQMPDF